MIQQGTFMNPDKEKNRKEGDDHLHDHQALEADRPRQGVRPTEELNIHQTMRMIQLSIEINQKALKSQKLKCHQIRW